MTTPDPTRERLFHAAAELTDPAQRAAFLDAACGQDERLRAEIDELLRHDADAGSFLGDAKPALTATVDQDPVTESPGTIIGPYKLMERIGEGGFGLVFVAEQREPVRRKVALKIIKPGMDSRQVIARFEAERQALAMMEHTNIAKVFDAGTTDSGRPYFVMELVHGVPITEFCDANKLSPRERMGLFVPVCHAIQHAHQKGVIHRDIKPGNVLVTMYDDKPVPKVIDFGVAKAIEQRLTQKTVYTQFGALVGTLEYMSPEQAEMNALGVDTRSDVYALGVLLYELLTGTTPLDRQRLRNAAFDEIIRLIREDEPPRPSVRLSSSVTPGIAASRHTEPAKLSRLLRGEVDWIVMKCLEKDRTRRYETANGVARDVERYLSDEPVEACPPTLGYRLRKLARKHKKSALTAAAFAILLAVGVVLIGWQVLQANRARQAEVMARLAAQESRDRAKMAADHATRAEGDARAEADQKEAALKRSTALHVAAHALTMAEENPELAAALAVEAARRSREPLTDEALLAAMEHLPSANTMLEAPAAINPWVRFVPGRKGFIAIDDERNFQFWDAATGRLVRTIEGLDSADDTRRVVVGPNGRRLAAIDEAGRVHLWNLETGRKENVLQSPVDGYNQIAFSPDGDKLAAVSGRWASANPKGQVTVWNLKTFEPRILFEADECFYAVAFSPDGGRLASEANGNRVRVWDTADGKLLLERPVENGLPWPGILFSSDGAKVISLARKGLHVWDVATGELTDVPTPEDVTSYNGYLHEVNHEAGVLLTCPVYKGGINHAFGHDGQVRVWDIANLKPKLTIGNRERRVSLATLSPEGGYVAAVVNGYDVEIWNVHTGEPHAKLLGPRRGVTALALGPGAESLITVHGGEARSWEVDDRGMLPTDPRRPAVNVAHLPEHGTLAALWWGRGIELLDPAALRVTGLIPLESQWDLAFMGYDRRYLAYSPGADRFAVRVSENTVLVIDRDTGEVTRRIERDFQSRGDRHDSIYFAGAGERLLIRYESGDVELIDADTGETVRKLHGTPGGPGWWRKTFALSQDGSRFLIDFERDNGAVEWHVHDGRTGERVRVLSHPGAEGMNAVAFSPDGRTLAAAFGRLGHRDTPVTLVDVGTGERRTLTPAHTSQLWLAEFSPDGRRLATADNTGRFVVWDVAGARKVAEIPAHDGMPHVLAFSADGGRLATSGPDRSGSGKTVAVIWDAATGEKLLEVDGTLECFVADDTALLTRSTAGLRAWPIDPLPALLRRGVRELTDEERGEYGLEP